MLNRLLKTIMLSITTVVAINSTTAYAQNNYPNRAIEWIIPYAPGGGMDIVARAISNTMSQKIGQTIVVLNKPGAATAVGAAFTANSKPDGYTFLGADLATLSTNPFIYQKLQYNPETDFEMVGMYLQFPLVLVVNPSVPANNYAEFMAWAKQQDQLPYASAGTGTAHHLAGELFQEVTQLKLTHIPYRGAAPAAQDVMSNQVPFMFIDTATGQKLIEGGQLKPIGVATIDRVKEFPTIPTFHEQGLNNFQAFSWAGLVVPKNTPDYAITTLNKAMREALNDEKVKETMRSLSLPIIPSSPEEMASFAQAEREKWGPIIIKNNIKAE